MPKLEPKRLIDFKALKSKGINYCREHIARLEKQEKFPKRVVLARDEHGHPKTIAWVEQEIDNWIEDLAAKREC